MLQYTIAAPSRIYTHSCFEDSNHRNEDITVDNMKQPLKNMTSESLEDEEQTKFSKERQRSISIICKSLLLGSSIGFALQGIAFAVYYTLFKMFGKDSTPTPISLRSNIFYCMLDIAIYVAIWLTFVYSKITKSGSLYMRKKFDKDAANPNSRSIWTRRMLLLVGISFIIGGGVGSFSLWIIVALRMRTMVIPLIIWH